MSGAGSIFTIIDGPMWAPPTSRGECRHCGGTLSADVKGRVVHAGKSSNWGRDLVGRVSCPTGSRCLAEPIECVTQQ